MNLKPVKHIQIDDQRGALYSAGKQSLLVPVPFIKALYSIFVRLAEKEGAEILIYKIGEAVGHGYAQSLEVLLKKEKTKLTVKSKIKMSCNAIFMEAGWGRVKIREIDTDKKLLEAELTYSPSREFFKKSDYSLEKGILVGIYHEIAKEEVYGELVSENRKKHSVILRIQKEIPEEIKEKEKMVLITRKKLEQMIKRKTKELQEERNKTRTVLVSLTDGLIVFDREERITLINPDAEKILNVKEAEIINKKIGQISGFPILDKLYKTLGNKVEWTGQRYELVLNKPFKRCFNVSVAPMIDEKETIGMIVILHDTTREKEVARMKSEFVSLAAHQLRTPLSAIKWILRMVIDGDVGSISEEQTQFLERGYESNERMIILINDLLNVTRIEEGRFVCNLKSQSFEDIIEEAVVNLRRMTEQKKVEIIFNKPKKSFPKVRVDKKCIALVMQNLLDNAVRFNKPGGKVTVSIKHDKINTEVMVKDTGIGIPRLQQSRIFSKFFRADNAVRTETEGTGLGLFISKNIIEAHGGKIWFESEEDKGSVFWFTIPIKT